MAKKKTTDEVVKEETILEATDATTETIENSSAIVDINEIAKEEINNEEETEKVEEPKEEAKTEKVEEPKVIKEEPKPFVGRRVIKGWNGVFY